MSILVTGGAGYIGSHTVVQLIEAGYDPIIVDNFSNSKPSVIQRIEEIVQRPVTYYACDILDHRAMSDVFEKHQIEAVIHFAAYKAVGESVQKPLKYYHNNVSGTLSLLAVMQEYQVKRIVFSSSATVYGMDHPSPLNEMMTIGKATNPYGYTKIVMEQILTDLAKSDEQWHVTLLRYFNPIGAHPTGLMGEDPSGIPNNLMPYVTQVAIGKRDKLSVYGDDYPTHDGTGVRDYIHVMDLAQGHVSALKAMSNQNGVHIYNLGTGEGYSVLDLVKTFQAVNHIDIPYIIEGRRAGDIATCYADPAKALKELGWATKRDLSDMCRDSWRWQKMNPQGYPDENELTKHD